MFDLLKAPAVYVNHVNDFVRSADVNLITMKEFTALAVTALMADVYAHKAEKNAIRANRMRRRVEVNINTYNFRKEMNDL